VNADEDRAIAARSSSYAPLNVAVHIV